MLEGDGPARLCLDEISLWLRSLTRRDCSGRKPCSRCECSYRAASRTHSIILLTNSVGPDHKLDQSSIQSKMQIQPLSRRHVFLQLAIQQASEQRLISQTEANAEKKIKNQSANQRIRQSTDQAIHPRLRHVFHRSAF